MKLKTLVQSIVFVGLIVSSAGAVQVGVWQFDGSLANALGGGAASPIGGWSASYNNQVIGGSLATVLSFPAMNNTQALDIPTGMAPDDGSATTRNNWSIVMDVRFESAGNYTSLWDVHGIGNADGDFFVRDTEGIGISGDYEGTYVPSDWNRIAVTIDASGTGYVLEKYINGVHIGTTGTGTSPDGKEGIVGGILHLFADEDGESSAGYINSVAIYDDLLSADAVSALGGPTAGGISAVPEPATLTLVACAVFVWVQFGGRRNGGRQ